VLAQECALIMNDAKSFNQGSNMIFSGTNFSANVTSIIQSAVGKGESQIPIESIYIDTLTEDEFFLIH